MSLNALKKGTNITMILLLIVLLTIPFYTSVYYVSMYYIIVIFALTPLVVFRIMRSDSMDNNFFDKWEKRREKGRVFNVLLYALQTIFLGLVITLGSQYIVNGRTLSFILSKLSKNMSIGLLIFLLIIGVLSGIAAWHENEKRFKKISVNSKWK